MQACGPELSQFRGLDRNNHDDQRLASRPFAFSRREQAVVHETAVSSLKQYILSFDHKCIAKLCAAQITHAREPA